ncbi:MAG: hypothetical protein EA357_02775 [Micavibrio sp.]|nr:MAG: hypothetical protein EA357_02775 [Micavibrio sp.]
MKYPEMRKELINHLRDLSDLQYQRECWVNGKCPGNVEHDGFDYAVHFLFDDTELALNAKNLIGFLLKDDHEANLIQGLCQIIENIFEKYGTGLSDAEYINCPEWTAVISSAKRAHLALLETKGAE